MSTATKEDLREKCEELEDKIKTLNNLMRDLTKRNVDLNIQLSACRGATCENYDKAIKDKEIYRTALETIVNQKWGSCKKNEKYLFCHPEGCDSPQIARDALKEAE